MKQISLVLVAFCCLATFATFVSTNSTEITDFEVLRLSLPRITSVDTYVQQNIALEILLKLIKVITGVDLKKIMLQLQTTVEESIRAVHDAVAEVEDLLLKVGLMDSILANMPLLIGQAAGVAESGVETMLELLLWVLSPSNLPLPLQAVVVVIAVASISIPAFLQGLLFSVLKVAESQLNEVVQHLPIIFEKFMKELSDQIEPLMRLLRPLIPGLP